MANYKAILPDEIINQFKTIDKNLENIMGEMTRAGAKVVESNIKANAPTAMKNSKVMRNLSLTKTYKTISNGAINTKILFSGYFEDKKGKKKPAPLIANLFEYGRSNAPFPKQPFFRKSFAPNQIRRAMLEAQKKASGGLLK